MICTGYNPCIGYNHPNMRIVIIELFTKTSKRNPTTNTIKENLNKKQYQND